MAVYRSPDGTLKASRRISACAAALIIAAAADGCGHPPREIIAGGLRPRVAPAVTLSRTLVGHPPLNSLSYVSLPATPAVVCAGGDVMLGGNLDTTWTRRTSHSPAGRIAALPDPDTLLAPLVPLVRDADVVMVNVEGAIGTGPAPRKCRPGSRTCYAFRQEPRVAAALRRLLPSGAVVGNVANNHALDAGPVGLAATIEHLKDAGVYVTGADTLPTLVPIGARDTLAVLGFSVFQAGPDARDVAALRRYVTRAAARYPVVVSMHVGAEGVGAQRTPDSTETYLGEDRGNSVEIARAAVEAGASLVIGHGPHVLRAMQWQRDRLVAYSLGNLVTYGPFSLREPLDRGAMLCAAVTRGGQVTHAELRSTRQRPPGVVAPDSAARAARLVDSLSQLDFPATGVHVTSTSAVIKALSTAPPDGP